MEELSWEVCAQRIIEWSVTAEEHLNITAKYIGLYRQNNDDQEKLSQILAELNFRVLHLGDLQSKFKRLELWTSGRYEIEKSLAALAIMREKKSASFAKEAKYEAVDHFLDIVVDASAMHMRLQNGRSSARDTTEAIRSRISQIKGAIRSS